MKKHFNFIFLILLVIVLLSYFTNAIELGVSPSEIRLKGEAGEELCENFVIFSKDYNGDIIANDEWKIGNSIVNISKAEVKIDYDKNFYLDDFNEEEICLTSKYGGNFRGIISFRAIDSNVEIGAIVKADISGERRNYSFLNTDLTEEKTNAKNNLLTGFSINDSVSDKALNIGLSSLTIVLMLVLMILLRKTIRK